MLNLGEMLNDDGHLEDMCIQNTFLTFYFLLWLLYLNFFNQKIIERLKYMKKKSTTSFIKLGTTY